MEKLLPRSPYERLGDYVHLPRLIDKAACIGGDCSTVTITRAFGFDKHLRAFLKIDPDAFEKVANEQEEDAAILAWVRRNGAAHSP